MNPYRQAFDAYHAHGTPDTSWTAALDYHLQKGVVVSTPKVFLMARRVQGDAPDFLQLTLQTFPAGTDWHVWSAAGCPLTMIDIAFDHGCTRATTITFARGTPHVRRYPFHKILRRLRPVEMRPQ